MLNLTFLLFLFFQTSEFYFDVSVIPKPIIKKMKNTSWHDGCPVLLKDLRYIQLNYWDFSNTMKKGELIVHKSVVHEVAKIFNFLFTQNFMIEKMNLSSFYKGDDMLSMKDNNTSAFNCRYRIDNDKKFSIHSYGKAIDINPQINPYIKGKKIYPPNAIKHHLRKNYKGSIKKGDMIINIFKKQNWCWGGNWKSIKDYQHFEKCK